MKPTERVLEVDSTLTGERVGMGIDTSALAHIMTVLTDLYSDPELAVIREYSTNALDAHRDAGQTRPIEVTLPTQLAPFFRVKDYGVGLSVEDIRNIYSRYGTSTKRESNDVVGMLGLGCKSALTYTDQFTLVSTKDGRTVQVSVSRDEDGGGSMTIVSDEATESPDGTEVIVPAKRDNKFDSKARDFFRFWSKGTVLVNGEPPKHIAETLDGTWLVQDKLLVVNREDSAYRYTSSPGWVVMGNVAYPMPEVSGGAKFRTVAFVEIGEVNFTPSREALQMTALTKVTLERIRQDTERELTTAMQKKVAAAATPMDAIRIAQEADSFGVKTGSLVYQNRAIPVEFSREGVTNRATLRPFLMVGRDRYAKKSGDTYRSITPHAQGRVYFTGFKAAEFSKPKRDKLDVWLEQNGIERPKQIVFVESLTQDEQYWTKGAPVYDWTPVQEIKVARDPSTGYSSSRPTGSYSMRLAGVWGDFTADQIPLGQPIVKFVGLNRWESGNTAERMPPEVTVVCLPMNRVGKFERDFPTAVTWRDYLKRQALDWQSLQDPEQLLAAWYQFCGGGRALVGLDHTRVADPDLARCIKLQNERVSAITAGIKQHRDHIEAPTGLPHGDPFEQYPLLHLSYTVSSKEHTYLYVNAAYFAATSSRQGEKEAA